MDVDNIPPGVDFVSYLDSQVAACKMFLAIIGPDWFGAKDDAGRRRLEDPADYVRVEIAAALARNISVVPVLVDGARLPKADQLADVLKPLVRRNAIEMRNTQFGRDADALTNKVREVLGRRRAGPGRWIMAAGAAAALLLASWIGLDRSGMPAWVPWPTAPRQPDPRKPAEAKPDTEAQRRQAPGPFMTMAGALDQGRWQKRSGNGGYRFVAGALEVYTHQGDVLMAADDSLIRQDFTYSIRAELVSGPTQLGFGLVFGMEDADNYFLFAKRTAGDYRLTHRQGGEERVLLPWTASTLITAVSRPQTLQVVSEGPFVTLLADGQKLQQVRIDREPTGSVGSFRRQPGLFCSLFRCLVRSAPLRRPVCARAPLQDAAFTPAAAAAMPATPALSGEHHAVDVGAASGRDGRPGRPWRRRAGRWSARGRGPDRDGRRRGPARCRRPCRRRPRRRARSATLAVPWSVPPVPFGATVRPNSVSVSTTVLLQAGPRPAASADEAVGEAARARSPAGPCRCPGWHGCPSRRPRARRPAAAVVVRRAACRHRRRLVLHPAGARSPPIVGQRPSSPRRLLRQAVRARIALGQRRANSGIAAIEARPRWSRKSLVELRQPLTAPRRPTAVGPRSISGTVWPTARPSRCGRAPGIRPMRAVEPAVCGAACGVVVPFSSRSWPSKCERSR